VNSNLIKKIKAHVLILFFLSGGGLWAVPFFISDKMDDLMVNDSFNSHEGEKRSGHAHQHKLT
jgi:hypothetical protein